MVSEDSPGLMRGSPGSKRGVSAQHPAAHFLEMEGAGSFLLKGRHLNNCWLPWTKLCKTQEFLERPKGDIERDRDTPRDQNSPSYITATSRGESPRCDGEIRLVTRKSKRLALVSHGAHPPVEPRKGRRLLVDSESCPLSSCLPHRCFEVSQWSLTKDVNFQRGLGPIEAPHSVSGLSWKVGSSSSAPRNYLCHSSHREQGLLPSRRHLGSTGLVSWRVFMTAPCNKGHPSP